MGLGIAILVQGFKDDEPLIAALSSALVLAAVIGLIIYLRRGQDG